MNEFKHIFADNLKELGRTDIAMHRIDIGDAPPQKQRYPYHAAPREQEFIKQEVQRMLENNLIQPSESDWASPVVIAKKKNGKLRFCVDYRKLNKATKKDSYPLPRVDDLLDAVGEATWFTAIDLASGYWQIAMDKKSQERTAFVV